MEAALDLKQSLEHSLLNGSLDLRGREKRQTKAGWLPSDWCVEPLKKLAQIDSGVTLNQDRAPKEHPCRYMTVAHIQRGKILFEDKRYLELFPEEHELRLLGEGDLLVVEGHASSLEIGRAALFAGLGEKVTYQNHLFRIRANTARILPKFLLHILNSERVQRHWNAICNTSSGLNTINRRNLRNLLIQFPVNDEQQEIIEILEAAECTISKAEHMVDRLEDVKASLLQNLLTGKIRIPPEAVSV